MTLAQLLQAVTPEIAALAHSPIMQVMAGAGVLIGLGSPGLAVAWKVVKTIRFNGRSGKNGHANGSATVKELAGLASEVKALDRRLDDRYDTLCDRVTEGNERTDKAIADVWMAVNRLRDQARNSGAA